MLPGIWSTPNSSFPTKRGLLVYHTAKKSIKVTIRSPDIMTPNKWDRPSWCHEYNSTYCSKRVCTYGWWGAFPSLNFRVTTQTACICGRTYCCKEGWGLRAREVYELTHASSSIDNKSKVLAISGLVVHRGPISSTRIVASRSCVSFFWSFNHLCAGHTMSEKNWYKTRKHSLKLTVSKAWTWLRLSSYISRISSQVVTHQHLKTLVLRWWQIQLMCCYHPRSHHPGSHWHPPLRYFVF